MTRSIIYSDDPLGREAEQALKAVLQRFTYRSGWFFEVDKGYLRVSMTTEDADKPGEQITLTFSQAIPAHYSIMRDFDWTRWLFEQVRVMEHHELQEFFRIDGKPVYEPHPELERTYEKVADGKSQTATELARAQST